MSLRSTMSQIITTVNLSSILQFFASKLEQLIVNEFIRLLIFFSFSLLPYFLIIRNYFPPYEILRETKLAICLHGNFFKFSGIQTEV